MSETATTVTLTDFLLARIAEDEAEARRLAERYDETDNMNWYGNSDDVEVHLGVGRALAECEAKRRIVERASAAGQVLGYDARWAFSETLRDLAAVYADHPDYREEWRP